MTLDEILENLRKTAEEFTSEASDTRRPTWAPALVVSEEFVNLARTLGLLAEGDKEIVRLWARFADPRPKGTLLRQEVGLTLPGIRCRGFELYVGTKRRGIRLFYAKRGEAGWETGPSEWRGTATFEQDQLFYERRNLERHIRYMREVIAESGGPEQQPNVAAGCARAQAEYDQLDVKHQAAKAQREAGDRQRACLLELARARVIELGGGGDAEMMSQMAAGARVTGNCCICGAVLTDPTSVEYGIGPICRGKQSRAIAEWIARHTAPILFETHANKPY
jgi:hypothetical protein